MRRRAIGALTLLAVTVACGSPVQRATNKLMEQVRLGDPLARETYEEDKDLLLSSEAVPIWTETPNRKKLTISSVRCDLRSLVVRVSLARNRAGTPMP